METGAQWATPTVNLHRDPRHAFTAVGSASLACGAFQRAGGGVGKPHVSCWHLVESNKARIHLHTLECRIDFIIGFIVYKNMVWSPINQAINDKPETMCQQWGSWSEEEEEEVAAPDPSLSQPLTL